MESEFRLGEESVDNVLSKERRFLLDCFPIKAEFSQHRSFHFIGSRTE